MGGPLSPSGWWVCLSSIPTPHIGTHKAWAVTPISETRRISDKSKRARPGVQAWHSLRAWALSITVPSCCSGHQHILSPVLNRLAGLPPSGVGQVPHLPGSSPSGQPFKARGRTHTIELGTLGDDHGGDQETPPLFLRQVWHFPASVLLYVLCCFPHWNDHCSFPHTS